MRSLPRRAQGFVLIIWMGGALSVLLTRYVALPKAQARFWELVLLLVLAVLAGGKKVHLMRHKTDEDVGSMSLGFAITFAAMLRFGPSAGLLTGTAGCLSSCLYPKRHHIHQLLFNVSLTAIEAWTAGLVFLFLNRWKLDLDPLGSFPAITASCLVYYAVNTGGVATVIALCTGDRPLRLWKETFLWTAPSYFAGAFISALALLLFGRQIGTMLLFITPVAYLTYQSYAVYTARAEEKQQHIEEMEISQAHLADLYLATIKSLALAIDAKDQYTHQHILRVQRYAVATAGQMGLNGVELEGINTGALLHDIGKLGVPEYVLLKPGRLTDEEFAKVKKHPEIGAAILDPVDFPWPVLPAVKYHHERWDGTGYPEGLKGEEIPLTARILAVADVYDALTSTRSYRTAWSHEKALELIRQESGSHFDPAVVDAFLQVIEDIVQDMAKEGRGPLAVRHAAPKPGSSKADQAVRDIQRASSELWALYEVAQTLSSSLGMQETLDILARKVAAILPGTACVFLLKDDSTDMLVARASVGLNTEFLNGGRTMNSRSRSLEVARSRVSYIGEYDPDDLIVNNSDRAQWTPLRTAMIVPIVHQGEVMGTLNLYHPQEKAFGLHDQQLLEAIAERAAMALYNGLLFDRARSNAFTDSLTGLYNIRYLTQYVDERCEKAVSRSRERAMHEDPSGGIMGESDLSVRQAETFSLLCMDLDSFKPINDNFSHQKGDQVLRDLSRIFRETVRERDIVARYGGDEFLIVLDAAGPAEAEAMAQRLQDAVEAYHTGLVHPRLGALHLGVSIGCASFPLDGRNCATLLSIADSRMYADKTERKLGRLAEKGNGHSLYAASDSELTQRRAA
jgi:diguanylate cyclase (GGDEF)-like protein/putative nucleotidyltransferase with HDIG domain